MPAFTLTFSAEEKMVRYSGRLTRLGGIISLRYINLLNRVLNHASNRELPSNPRMLNLTTTEVNFDYNPVYPAKQLILQRALNRSFMN